MPVSCDSVGSVSPNPVPLVSLLSPYWRLSLGVLHPSVYFSVVCLSLLVSALHPGLLLPVQCSGRHLFLAKSCFCSLVFYLSAGSSVNRPLICYSAGHSPLFLVHCWFPGCWASFFPVCCLHIDPISYVDCWFKSLLDTSYLTFPCFTDFLPGLPQFIGAFGPVVGKSLPHCHSSSGCLLLTSLQIDRLPVIVSKLQGIWL